MRLLRDEIGMLRDAAIFFIKDRCLLHASGLAFGAVFALPPVFVIVIAVVQHFARASSVESEIVRQAALSVGPSSAQMLDTMVRASWHNAEHGSLASPIAWAFLVGTACAVFITVQDSLSLIWAAEPAPPRPLPHALRAQVAYYALAFGLALATLVALIVDAAVMVALTSGDRGGVVPWQQSFGVAAISFLIFGAVVAALFRYLPNIRVHWNDIVPGAMTSAALIVAVQWTVALYFRAVAMERAYGPAASFLALMMWIFFTAITFYFGAEVTKVRLEARKRAIEGGMRSAA